MDPSRSLTYETTLACAARMGRVRPFELARTLGVDWRDVVPHLERMQREGLALRPDASGWRVMTAPSPAPEPSDTRLDALRRLIARELHPDLSDAPAEERAVRGEIFKKIWPMLDGM